MESHKKSLQVMVLLLVYCLALFNSGGSHSTKDFSPQKLAPKENHSAVQSDFFAWTAAPESHAEVQVKLPYFPDIKEYVFFAGIVSTDLESTVFSMAQELVFSGLISSAKSRLLFPFHFFW
ncbi:MAG: hypothetical protein ACPF8V_06980 [Luteibaculum sp.]